MRGPPGSSPGQPLNTVVCAAPEAIANDKNVGPAAISWSCGVLLYILLFHSYPFEQADDPAGSQGQRKVHAQRSAC